MRRPTIKDVAERAKVSLKTVSRVINNEPSVMQATRARVLRAIADLDYEPDPSARNLRSGTPFVIGLVYDNPNPYHIIGIQNGVLAACRETGFGLQIHPCDSTSPLLAEELAEWVQRSRLAGVVLTAPMSERSELMAGLAARGIKSVRIIAATDDPGDGPCVYIDDRAAAYEITEHLVQLGHQRIGFLWGGPQHRSSGERYAGYEAALKDYGITLDKHLVIPGDYTFDDGFRGARRLLSLREPPTAIFGSNDEIAAGVLAAAKSTGMNVPYQLSIAGFEDSPFSRQSWPALTTAKQATDDIARHAARLLISQLRSDAYDDQPAQLQNRGFVPQLVVRGSTAPAQTPSAKSLPPESA
ncbi:LacI family DNA-binding transcriptional regulator [Xanthomonas arboricola]|uniref:LacI family DNA-binding transcriptional regulator n=1 Tax=Xanthomonas arboricola TaxID=56448 RepID=UPI001AF03397|nr:LacI family DNA-binding transcriptional regulator [Xanthomonas arboricola]CAD7377628.1 LacI family DNA-binding transcriptional regulator [Xanthomonas arboricola]CAG2085483.1 LacI family DNA-binding transcriptional regulator [Xanthomonas arboricola pv. juglandis]